MTQRSLWQTGLSVNIPYFNAERMSELYENGIYFVELCSGKCEHFTDFKNTSVNLYKAAVDNNITVRSIHLPFSPFSLIDPASKDKCVRDEFFKIQSEIIKIAVQNGTKIAVVHPSGEPYKPEDRQDHLNFSVESMIKLHETAKNEGLVLAVENLPRTCILRDCDEIKYFIKNIPDIHFVFDSNHSLKDKNTDIIKAMGERIVTTHISDYDFIDERHLLPGDGKVCWQEIMSELEKVNYSGTWTYELNNTHLISAETIKTNHLKILDGTIK